MNKKRYYCTPSKGFDTFLCALGWLAIQMALIGAVSNMIGKAAAFLIDNASTSESEKLSVSDEICTSCEDRFKEVKV